MGFLCGLAPSGRSCRQTSGFPVEDSERIGRRATPITKRRKMCYACFENGRKMGYADNKMSENVLRRPRNRRRMCYAVKIRRYRPAVRTADVGKFAMPITKRRKMCYADHEIVENVLADHAMSEDVLCRSRNVRECATSITQHRRRMCYADHATASENVQLHHEANAGPSVGAT